MQPKNGQKTTIYDACGTENVKGLHVIMRCVWVLAISPLYCNRLTSVSVGLANFF
jgi:hypothetical protein